MQWGRDWRKTVTQSGWENYLKAVSMQETSGAQWLEDMQSRRDKTMQDLRRKKVNVFILHALTQVSCQWDRREGETSKERLSSWHLKPIQKHQKSLIKAWLLCVLLSPFAYWEFYFVSFSFCDSNLFTSSSSLLLTVSLYARISLILASCIKGNCIGLI